MLDFSKTKPVDYKPLNPWRMLIEALIVGALIIPAIRFLGTFGPKIGISHPVFPVQGIFISAAVGFIFMRLSRTSLRDIGLFLPKGFFKTVILALLTTVIIFLISPFIAEVILPTFGIPFVDLTDRFVDRFEGNTKLYIPYMIFVVWFSACIGEEIVARGFIFHRMERFFNSFPKPWLFAAVAQGVIFGACHFFYGLNGMVMTGVIGVILAMLFLISGRNLWAPILAHAFINSIYITSYYLGTPV